MSMIWSSIHCWSHVFLYPLYVVQLMIDVLCYIISPTS